MWTHFQKCADTDFVNCKFAASGPCLKHMPREHRQTTPPTPYVKLADRRKKHEFKPKAPKTTGRPYMTADCGCDAWRQC